METLNKALQIHGVRTDQHPCPGGAGSLVEEPTTVTQL